MHADILEESAQAAPSVKPVHPTPTRRQAQLAGVAEDAGIGWAQQRIRELTDDQRDIVGGWPGTMREARAVILKSLERSLPPSFAISHDETQEVIRTGYAAARRTWLARRVGREPTESIASQR